MVDGCVHMTAGASYHGLRVGEAVKTLETGRLTLYLKSNPPLSPEAVDERLPGHTGQPLHQPRLAGVRRSLLRRVGGVRRGGGLDPGRWEARLSSVKKCSVV